MEDCEKERIADIVADIMINDGPDGHCDGCEVIAEYIKAIVEGTDTEWESDYFKNKDRHVS